MTNDWIRISKSFAPQWTRHIFGEKRRRAYDWRKLCLRLIPVGSRSWKWLKGFELSALARPRYRASWNAMTNPTKSRSRAIKPDRQDFGAVEKEYGPLPPTASQALLAERYRQAQAAKVIRKLEQVAFSGKTMKPKV